MTRDDMIHLLKDEKEKSLGQFYKYKFMALDAAIRALESETETIVHGECMTNQEWLSHISPEDWVRVIHWLYHDYGTRFTDSEGAILKWLRQDMREEQE